MKNKKILIGIGAGFSLVVIIFLGLLYANTRAIGDGSKKMDFAVKAGWGHANVTNALYENGIINSRFFFSMYLRLTGKSGKIKKGIYDIHDGLSAGQIAAIITSGKGKTIPLTIPEGYHNRQIAEVMVEKKFFASKDEFVKYASKTEILKKFNIPAKTAEGYLFPDTYHIPAGYPKDKIIVLMIEQFFDKVKSVKGFPTDPAKIHELVILASIVEREAQRHEERPLVSGVFANRIKKNLPLESCATIQYLFEKPHKRIFFKDLEINSPYNTYKNNGLPPGPIANPGIPAIQAALNPAQTDYMFFVVKGDGYHQFSKSFSDHLKAKNKYLGP